MFTDFKQMVQENTELTLKIDELENENLVKKKEIQRLEDLLSV